MIARLRWSVWFSGPLEVELVTLWKGVGELRWRQKREWTYELNFTLDSMGEARFEFRGCSSRLHGQAFDTKVRKMPHLQRHKVECTTNAWR